MVSSRGGLECIGVRFSFSKFGTSALRGSNPALGIYMVSLEPAVYTLDVCYMGV